MFAETKRELPPLLLKLNGVSVVRHDRAIAHDRGGWGDTHDHASGADLYITVIMIISLSSLFSLSLINT